MPNSESQNNISEEIEVKHKNLDDVIKEVGRGVLRIPRFQRDYVWERSRVAKLFDSIYRKFPIGSFFYWITPSEYRDFYKETPELNLPKPDKYEQVKMILDGQQRITSLYVAAKGLKLEFEEGAPKDYKKICFDLDIEQFLVVGRNEDKEKIISVWRFFDQDGEDEIYDDLSRERRSAFKKCKRALNNYPVSIVEVNGKHLDEAVTIFERINQGGKKLGLFDLVVASTWSEDFDLKEKTAELNRNLKEKGFGKIDEEIIAQVLSLVIKGQCTRSFQLQLTHEEIHKNWENIKEGIFLAIDFLRTSLGVKIYDFIPYPSMIAMMAFVFVKNNFKSLSASKSAFLKEWFWKSSFSQRYGASTLTIMGNDISDYFISALKDKNVEINFPVNLSEEEISKLLIYKRSAVKNAIFCLLATKNPKHFNNNSEIILDYQNCSDYNSSEKHHVFPNAFLKNEGIKHRHLLLNFAFIPSIFNKELAFKGPAGYFSQCKEENKFFAETMKSHLIPFEEDSAIWCNDYDRFIRERCEIIYGEIKKLVGEISAVESKLEEEPVQAVDDLEKNIRVFLNDKLSMDIGDDYWNKIPGDIQDRVNKKTGERSKRHPYERKNLTGLDKLGFCDIMDYAQIIEKNWTIFNDSFGSRDELKKHFLNLKEYRNAIMHGRKMNRVEKKQGEASVEWLSAIISGYFDSNTSSNNS